jgi:COMPASS component SWD3
VRTDQNVQITDGVTEGDWSEAEKLLLKETFKSEPEFCYAVNKQIYLELIEKHEYQKVLQILYIRC